MLKTVALNMTQDGAEFIQLLSNTGGTLPATDLYYTCTPNAFPFQKTPHFLCFDKASYPYNQAGKKCMGGLLF